MNQAKKLNGKYITTADVIAAGGKWSEQGLCYVFPDGSTGGFTNIRDGGREKSLHFVGGKTVSK